MQDELNNKENPIDKKVEEILAAWGARQSNRRGFLTKVSKVAFGTLVGATFGMGLPMGKSLLRHAEAADCNCTATPYCNLHGELCCACGGSQTSCPPNSQHRGGQLDLYLL